MANQTEALARYQHSRRLFYARFPSFWADFNNREYALYQTYAVSSSEREEIRQTVRDLWHLYRRLAPLLRTLPDESLLQMGLPASSLPLARLSVPNLPETVIGRFDLARTPEGYKLLEFNADTPTFLYECFEMNGLICAEFGQRDCNQDENRQLAQAFQQAVLVSLQHVGWQPGQEAHIAFAAYAESEEDKGTAEYLMGLTDVPKSVTKSFVDVRLLHVDAQGLYDAEERRIDVLYRLYPIEFFARDRDPATDAPSGEILFDLVRRRQLALLNPPSAFLLQSKAVQVILWGLMQSGDYFTSEEQQMARHLLPTYLDPVFSDRHVIKPVLGREGDTVSIVIPNVEEVVNTEQHYIDQPMVYQKYVELPRIEIMTEQGKQSLPSVLSCFVLNGEPAGIGMRVGGPITDITAYFLPLCLS